MNAKNGSHHRPRASPSRDINIAATTRDICFLLLVFAVAMGFTYQFGYMQRLGSEMELAEQPIPDLAVDALMVISANAWLYGGAVILAITTFVLSSVARRRGWLALRESESTIVTLVVFTGVLSALSYRGGREDAAHFFVWSSKDHDLHAHEIFVPPQMVRPQQCYESGVPTMSPAEVTNGERWYLTAESSSRYHVIRQTLIPGGHAAQVQPMVIEAEMLKCFQQLPPGTPPPTLATPTPADEMLPTPLPASGAVARAGGHRQPATRGVQ